MGKIEDLRKKLYSNEGVEQRDPEGDDFMQVTRRPAEPEVKHVWTGPAGDDQLLKEKYVEITREPSHRLLYSFIGVGSLVLIGLGVFIYYQLNIPHIEAGLVIVSKSETEVGAKVHWEILVENKSSVPFRDTELVFTYPKGAIPITESVQAKRTLVERIKIGDLATQETKRYQFEAELFGLEKEQKEAGSLLIYRPESLKSKMTKKISWVTTLTRVPIIVAMSFPGEVRSGQEMELDVTIDSVSGAVFRNISFGIDYPVGFEFKNSDSAPLLDSKNTWFLGDIQPHETKKITIHGTIKGPPEEVKAFIGRIGEYDEHTREWTTYAEVHQDSKIARAPLYVYQQVNGKQSYIADPGEDLRFTVHYQNNYREAIKDIFVKTKISESVFEMRTLTIRDGFYDGNTHEIVWNAGSNSDLKEVSPGAGGDLTYDVRLKNQPPIKSASDKNYVIRSSTAIDTKSVLSSLEGVKIDYHDDLDIKLNSRPSIISKVIHYNSPLKTLGSVPPRVGQETGYTIIWQVGNLANDIKDFKVTATLPGNVNWLNIVSGDRAEQVRVNQTTGEIIWDIGLLEAGAGIIGPRLTLMFLITITPGENLLGQSPLLVDNIKVVGTDTFTNKDYVISGDKLNTQIRDDPLSKSDDWMVKGAASSGL